MATDSKQMAELMGMDLNPELFMFPAKGTQNKWQITSESVEELRKQGMTYLEGNSNTEKDSRKAFEYFSKAANLGDVEAMFLQGQCFETGNGAPNVNLAEAFTLYKQAAAKKNISAIEKLIEYFEKNPTSHLTNLENDPKVLAEYYLTLIRHYALTKNIPLHLAYAKPVAYSKKIMQISTFDVDTLIQFCEELLKLADNKKTTLARVLLVYMMSCKIAKASKAKACFLLAKIHAQDMNIAKAVEFAEMAASEGFENPLEKLGLSPDVLANAGHKIVKKLGTTTMASASSTASVSSLDAGDAKGGHEVDELKRAFDEQFSLVNEQVLTSPLHIYTTTQELYKLMELVNDNKQLDRVFELGMYLLQNFSSERKPIIMLILQLCAEKGHAEACFQFYRVTVEFDGDGADRFSFIFYLKKAANQGHTESQYVLAELLEERNDRGLCDPEMAFSYYQAAANNYYKAAMLKLAHCYEFGKGTDIDLFAASDLYNTSNAANRNGKVGAEEDIQRIREKITKFVEVHGADAAMNASLNSVSNHPEVNLNDYIPKDIQEYFNVYHNYMRAEAYAHSCPENQKPYFNAINNVLRLLISLDAPHALSFSLKKAKIAIAKLFANKKDVLNSVIDKYRMIQTSIRAEHEQRDQRNADFMDMLKASNARFNTAAAFPGNQEMTSQTGSHANREEASLSSAQSFELNTNSNSVSGNNNSGNSSALGGGINFNSLMNSSSTSNSASGTNGANGTSVGNLFSGAAGGFNFGNLGSLNTAASTTNATNSSNAGGNGFNFVGFSFSNSNSGNSSASSNFSAWNANAAQNEDEELALALSLSMAER